MAETFAVKLEEKRYLPDPRFKATAWTPDYTRAYQEFMRDPDAFWDRIARELIWFEPWDLVMEWNYPYAKWFVNGKLNITYNCLDRHVTSERKDKPAIIWRGEQGEEQRLTYDALYREVMRFANGLLRLGVRKGDRVCIYMPLVPEQIVAMLACARIGAIHSVVFAGFGADALAMRINDAEAKILITADVSYRRGKAIPLREIAKAALTQTPCVEKVIVLRRGTPAVDLDPAMEVDYADLCREADPDCPAEAMDAEDPLFILYTSGSTGTPKGIVHTCGGYAVGTYYTTRHDFDIKETDVFWCTADPGWITGHSYVVYGPLMVGTTVVIVEGTPDYPDPGIYWHLIQDLGVTIFYTAPTAIRMFMRYGDEWPAKLRPLLPPGARVGRRAPQPRSVRVVLPPYRRRAMPDRGHLVADRDWHAHHHHDDRRADETGICWKTYTRRCRGRRRSAGQPCPTRHRRFPGHQGTLARHAQDGLPERRTLSHLLGNHPGVLHDRRPRGEGRGGLHYDPRAGRRSDHRLRAQHRHRGNRERARLP